MAFYPAYGPYPVAYPELGFGYPPPDFYEHVPAPLPQRRKSGFDNRKISADSGISERSAHSRKVSAISTGNASTVVEEDEEETLPPMETPSPELCKQLVEQVEFYFSDANITKDKFLLKHVRRNKEGFVSLKLISSFKRVKHLSRDWRQVAFAVAAVSKNLEVNDLGTKVRRLAALPEYDETTPSRTIVATNLGLERPTIEAVAELFADCGDIVLVRILRPGNPVPADVKPFVQKWPEWSEQVCALVEFERTEMAVKALNTKHHEENKALMQVKELVPPPPKTTKNKEEKKLSLARLVYENSAAAATAAAAAAAEHAAVARRFSFVNMNNGGSSGEPRQRRVSLMASMKFAANHNNNAKSGNPGLNPNAPSFHMELAAPALRRPLAPASAGLSLPPNVARLPRGPGESKGGFQRWCRTRMADNNKGRVRKSHAIPIVRPDDIDKIDENKEESDSSVESESKTEHVEKEEEPKMEDKEEVAEEVTGAVNDAEERIR